MGKECMWGHEGDEFSTVSPGISQQMSKLETAEKHMHVIQKHGQKERHLKAYEELASTGKNEEWGGVDGLLFLSRLLSICMTYFHKKLI